MSTKPLVVITGASQGIGKALAIKFSQAGYPLLLISRTITPLEELVEKENIIYAQVDVSEYQSLENAIRGAEDKFGKTECLINNAGILNIQDFKKTSVENDHRDIDILLKGVMNGCKIVLNDMAARKSGTIVNLSSVGDRKPFKTGVAYTASKHAIYSLSECLQQAEAKNNIRVINIAPGLVKTNIHANMGISFAEYSESLGNPQFLQANEIADIVYFCWNLPQHICIRDMVIMPTDCDF